MITSPVIFAVIPTFNRVQSLRECIESLLKQNITIAKIIIIDSNSSDSTRETIEKSFPDVHIISGFNDWWWARCMNEGISYALKNGADYIIAMNDDTYLGPETLQYLIESANLFSGSIIGSIVIDRNQSGKSVSAGIGARYSKYRWIPEKRIICNVEGGTIYYTEGQSGRGVLFPRSVYESIGLYDDINFPQHADRDFSYRCLKGGIGQYLDSRAVTYLNFSMTQIGMNEKRLKFKDIKEILFNKKGIYNIRNQYNFLRKHYFFWPFWFVIWACFVFSVLLVRIFPGGTSVVRKSVNKLLWNK